MNFTVLQQQLKDLPPADRKRVFEALPPTLQDEAWTNHAKWLERRSLESEWMCSGSPLGFVEWMVER